MTDIYLTILWISLLDGNYFYPLILALQIWKIFKLPKPLSPNKVNFSYGNTSDFPYELQVIY